MPVDVKYKTSATAIGGRDGRTRTGDGKIDLQLAVPKELGGPGGEGTNPEQLFAAGYAACFLGAIKVAGQQLKVRIPSDAAVTAAVGIGARSEGGFGITAELGVRLPDVDHTQARQVTADLVNSELEAERAYWLARLANLETLLCELLVKNERLRQERLMFTSEQPNHGNAQTDS